MTFSFEKLIVWQKAKQLGLAIYKTTPSFPTDEKFGLVSQIRRSAISVSSNLAEGSARQSGKDKARFSEIAYSSLIEVLNQLIISLELNYISEKTYNNLRLHIEEISRMINALRKTQLNP